MEENTSHMEFLPSQSVVGHPVFKKKEDRSMHQEKLHTLLANLTEKRYDSNAASNGTI